MNPPFFDKIESPYFKLQRGTNSGKLLIVFSSMKIPAGRFTFVRSLLDFPYDVLFVNDERNGWYQNGVPSLGKTIDDTCAAIKRIAEGINAKELFTMGSSMGGYGALLFGAKLEVPSLALDPETVLDLTNSRSAKNMPRDAERNFQDLFPILNESSSPAYIYSGEMDIVDVINSQRVSSLKLVTVITLVDQAHSAAAYLHELYGICKLANDFVNGKTLPIPPNHGNICDQADVVEALANSEESLTRRDFHGAVSILAELTSRSDLPGVFWYRLGVAQILSGDVQGAVVSQQNAIEKSPYFGKAHLQLGIGLRRTKQLTAAIQSFDNAEKLGPSMAATHFQKGLTFRDMSMHQEAESAFKAAWQIEPDNKAVCEALSVEVEIAITTRQKLLQKLRKTPNSLL